VGGAHEQQTLSSTGLQEAAKAVSICGGTQLGVLADQLNCQSQVTQTKERPDNRHRHLPSVLF
jgi:hypothetical protein